MKNKLIIGLLFLSTASILKGANGTDRDMQVLVLESLEKIFPESGYLKFGERLALAIAQQKVARAQQKVARAQQRATRARQAGLFPCEACDSKCAFQNDKDLEKHLYTAHPLVKGTEFDTVTTEFPVVERHVLVQLLRESKAGTSGKAVKRCGGDTKPRKRVDEKELVACSHPGCAKSTKKYDPVRGIGVHLKRIHRIDGIRLAQSAKKSAATMDTVVIN